MIGLPPGGVTIRTAVLDDLPAILDIYNASITTANSNFDSRPATLDERTSWFTQFAQTGPYRLLVARDDGGGLLGYACSSRYRAHEAFRETVEVSISLASAARGRGIGSMLYAQLVERLDSEDVHVALAGIALPNNASVALHRKFGFTEVGVFREYAVVHGNYVSSVWMQRLWN